MRLPRWLSDHYRVGASDPKRRAVSAVIALCYMSLLNERLPSGLLITGNLPYNVGTVLVRSTLEQAGRLPRAAFLLQEEVVRRIVARPGARDYGALSVLTAASAEARMLGRVKPGSFHPPPKVHSAFVGLELDAPRVPREDLEGFTEVVFAAFAMRRKTLRNGLSKAWGRSETDEILLRAALDGRRRAEELGLDDFRALFEARRDFRREIVAG